MKRTDYNFFNIIIFFVFIICSTGCADKIHFASNSAKIYSYSSSAIMRIQLSLEPRNRFLFTQCADDVEKIVQKMKDVVKEIDEKWFLDSDQKRQLEQFKDEMDWWDDVLVKIRAGDIDGLTLLMINRPKSN